MIMLVTLAAMLIAAGALTLQQRQVGRGTVTIDGRIRVYVEVAATPATRAQGLSGHAPLAADEGMLFIFEQPGLHGFWMKDMLFPLDFLWIRDGVLVDLTPDVPAPVPGQPLPSYFPREPVDAMLEVPAGFARQHGLKLGLPVTYGP